MQNTLTSKKQLVKKSVPMKIINALLNVIVILILLLALAVIFISVQSKATGATPSIGGIQILKVISGSMEPAIHTGSVIFIKEVDPEQLKVGDVITFKSMEYDNQLVTHRIAEINNTDTLSFTTRGDANDANDNTPALAADVKGIEVFTIPLLGYIMEFLQSRQGILIMIIVPGAAVIVYEIFQIIKYIRNMGAKKNEAGTVPPVQDDAPAQDDTQG